MSGDAWYAWALIAAATGASAYLNAAHAPPRWDARLVAGAVPLALLASVHLLVLLLLRVLAWRPPATSGAIPTEVAVAPTEPVQHRPVARHWPRQRPAPSTGGRSSGAPLAPLGRPMTPCLPVASP